jgi:AbrB family looped-hinge helix DNA binding protein
MRPGNGRKKRTPTALPPAPKLITVRRNGQLTLPSEIRRGARIEPGDLLAAEVVEDGVMLRPRKLVDPAQAYFWTRRWQRGERDAQRDIASGRVRRFSSVEEAMAALKK